MLLPDHEIHFAIASNRIGCDPFTGWKQIQPASLEVHLAWHWDQQRDSQPGDEMWVHPGGSGFALAHTVETIRLPADIAAQLSTKSTLARLGLSSHQTAGWIDPGFRGQLVLELSNASDTSVRLHHGQAVAQLVFMRLVSPARDPYGSPRLGSHYQNQKGTTPSYLEVAPENREVPFETVP